MLTRPITRGITRPITRPLVRQSSVFDPLTLWAQGQQGAWYAPWDLSTLFQDSAGTTPVTADVDPVGLMLDKSGNGNHASQSTTAAKPTKVPDALRGDGVDDVLSAVVSPTYQGPGIISLLARATTLSQPLNASFLATADTTPDGSVQFELAGSQVRLNVGLNTLIQGPSMGADWRVLSLFCDGAEIRFRVDGIDYGSVGQVLNVAGTLKLFQNRGGNRWVEGDIGGVIAAFGQYPLDALESAEKYLADRVGVTLP